MQVAKQDHYKKRLKDFIKKRMNAVLDHPHLNIKIQRIMANQRLELTFFQLKDMYNKKITHLANQANLQEQSQTLLEKDIMGLFLKNNKVVGRGVKVTNKTKRMQKCSICDHHIIMSVSILPFRVYNACQHAFHLGCI